MKHTTKRKTLKEVKKDVELAIGKDYKVISTEYINNKTPIKLKHLVCGKEYHARLHDILVKKTGCPFCFGCFKKTFDEFINEVPDEYEYISGFINYTTYSTFLHKICGHKFKMYPTKLIHGRQCPKCGGTKKKTNKEFLNQIKFLPASNDYKFLDEYINDKTKIRVKHLKCDHIYEVRPGDFIRGRRCPKCKNKESRATMFIENFLINNKIPYNKEAQFNGVKSLKNHQLFRFDFYIEDLNLIIEYDGIQHFINTFGYDNTSYKENDIIKNEWCKKKKVALLRIDYKNEKNLFEILNNIIMEKSSETIERFKLYYISEDSKKILNEKSYYSKN
jgi:very-short-patch-repair endonuclease/Zn ribbon nucleic-acid-binding protein